MNYLFLKSNTMKKQDYTIRIGVYMFASIAAFFLLMKLVGLEDVTELRFLNILIIAIFSNRLAKLSVEDQNKIEYLQGLKSIFMANVINVILCVSALVLYIVLIEPSFVSSFVNGSLFGEETSLSKVAVGIFMEGMAGSAIVSFTTMQYWKGVVRKTTKIDIHKV